MGSVCRTTTGVSLTIATVFAASFLVAGCAAGGAPTPAGTSPAEPSATAAASSSPSRSGGSQTVAGDMVLRGRMIEGVETGCRILRAENGETYELLDLPDELARPGTRVEVRGAVADDMMSFCMQGTIFQVTSARRL
jgi:hypothetical protein